MGEYLVDPNYYFDRKQKHQRDCRRLRYMGLHKHCPPSDLRVPFQDNLPTVTVLKPGSDMNSTANRQFAANEFRKSQAQCEEAYGDDVPTFEQCPHVQIRYDQHARDGAFVPKVTATWVAATDNSKKTWWLNNGVVTEKWWNKALESV